VKNKVLQAIVEIAGNVSPTLGKAVEETCGKLDKVNLKAVAVAAAAAAGAVAVGKATIEAGKYLVDLGSQFDEVNDSIRIGTGATGEALEGLMDDFDAVYSSVPTTMEDASTAIADYNTRLGLTGETLQGVSTQAIQVADMLGEDLSGVIESSSKAFQQWNIDADNMGGAMDYVFKVSQSTGTGFTELMETVQSFGPQLQEMGYSFEEAAALVGQLEKAGVNTEEVLGAMKKSTAALAKEGIGAAEGLDMYADAIINAKDMTQATEIATEVFGTRAASTMAAALRDGSISADELTKSLMENGETISECATDTYDFAEQLQLFKQQAQVALEPLAATMFDSLNELMPIVGDLMESLIPVIQDLAATLTPLISNLVAKIGPLLAQLVPPIVRVVAAIAEKLIPPLVEIISTVLPVLIQLAEMLMPIVVFIAEDVLPLIVSVIQALLPELMKIVETILPVISDLLSSLMPLFSQIIDAILPVVIDLIHELVPIFLEIVQAILPVLKDLISTILPILMDFIDQILPVVLDLLDSLMPLVTEITEAVLPVIISLLSMLIPLLADILSAILPVIIELINSLLPVVIQIIDAVLPLLIEILGVLMPILNIIISLLGPILDLFLMLLQPILDLILMAIGPLIDILGSLIIGILEPLQPILQFIASLFSDVLGGAMANIQPIIDNLMTIFGGLINFISGVFSGNWEQAWDGIVSMFKGIFNLIPSTVESVINGAIDMINGIIKGINAVAEHVGLEIDLIPKVTLPRFAAGGFTDGMSIAGEAGTEAIISFDPAYHEENVGYWKQAGKLLGVLDDVELNAGANAATAASLQMEEAEAGANETPLIAQAGKLMELDDFSLGQLTETTIIYYDFSGFTYAPQVEAGTDTDKEDIVAALKEHASEFFDWLEEWLRQKEVGEYDRVSIY